MRKPTTSDQNVPCRNEHCDVITLHQMAMYKWFLIIVIILLLHILYDCKSRCIVCRRIKTITDYFKKKKHHHRHRHGRHGHHGHCGHRGHHRGHRGHRKNCDEEDERTSDDCTQSDGDSTNDSGRSEVGE